MPEDARDASHLRVLSILHYVSSGLGIIVLLFLVGHYLVMRAAGEMMQATAGRVNEEARKQRESVVSDPDRSSVEPVQEIPTDFFETIFDSLRWLYLVIAFWVVLKMALNFLAARFLACRQNRTFVIVVAALNCLSIPLGTALGVFTLVVLSRPSMRGIFSEVQPQAMA
jgi:hypothetical protein